MAKNKNFKKPKTASKVIAEPKADDSTPPGKLKPEYMHLGCFDGCDKEDKAAFAAKLCHLSQLTWDEISSQNRYKMGFELLPQDQIKVPIPKHITPEVRIMVFRFHGMKPMLGYRDGQIYYPFWLDTDFSAYDHGS